MLLAGTPLTATEPALHAQAALNLRGSCSFRPARPQVPTTFAEVLCQSLHDGDITGAWFCFSSGVLKAAGAGSIAMLLLHIVRWAGGWVGGWVGGGGRHRGSRWCPKPARAPSPACRRLVQPRLMHPHALLNRFSLL